MNEFGIVAGLKGFIRPLDFEGRSTRTEAIALAIVYAAILGILLISGLLYAWLHAEFWLRGLLLFSLYPWPAMLTRRAHDAGQSAWIALAAVIFSSTPLLIVWPGDEAENEFGPDPRSVNRQLRQSISR